MKIHCEIPCKGFFSLYVQAGTVWINCHNMFDAAAGFGGYRQSGYGRDGGKEGLWEYMKPNWQKNPRIGKLDVNLAKFGAAYNAGKPAINGFQDQAGAAPKVNF